ncbi:MAG: bifunctional demethylmenaquinone methyltransferase/2-methoxy-6-polyprenyl-1,4-benzoquinol methylase UbiE [Planctomycetaceae bacterium]
MPVDKSQLRVRRMFASIAPRYDRMNQLLTLGLDRYWRKRTVQSVPLIPDQPVLDVCCGTGDLTLAWARRLGQNAVVLGTDFTHTMLMHARDKSPGINETIHYVGADTLRLPCPDNRFQVVSAGFGIRNVGETRRGLAEMTRVCGPDGHVVILETSSPRWPVVRQLFGLYFNHVMPRIGRWLSPDPDAAYSYLAASSAEFPQGEAFAELMREAGLVDVTVRPLTLGTVTVYVARKPGPRRDERGDRID